MDSKERKDKQNTDKTIKTTQRKTRNKKKQLVNFDAYKFKNRCFLSKKTDVEIANQANQHFENTTQLILMTGGDKFDFNHFDHKKLASLKSQKEKATKNLEWHEALALAKVLNCFAVDFLKNEILELGCFEAKIIDFNNGLEYNDHMLELEKYFSHRVGLFPSFPVYPYRPISTHNKQIILPHDGEEEVNRKNSINDLIEKNIKSNDLRLNSFHNGAIKSDEFYPIDSFIKFLFSSFESPLSIDQKKESIDRMVRVFKGITRNNCYFYASADFYQRQFAFIEIFKSEDSGLVYFNLPIRSALLAIKSKAIYSQLSDFFFKIKQKQYFKSTTNEESIELLEKGLEYLKDAKKTFFSFDDFKKKLESDNLKELLKLAFPHL